MTLGVVIVDCAGLLDPFPTTEVVMGLFLPSSMCECEVLVSLKWVSPSDGPSPAEYCFDEPGRAPSDSSCSSLMCSREWPFSSPLSTVTKLVALVAGEMGVMVLLYVLKLWVRVQLLRCEFGAPEPRPVELVLA